MRATTKTWLTAPLSAEIRTSVINPVAMRIKAATALVCVIAAPMARTKHAGNITATVQAVIPRSDYLNAIEAEGLQVKEVRKVESISLVAVRQAPDSTTNATSST